MRLLLGPPGAPEGSTANLTDDDLVRIHVPPAGPWLRVNMVSTLDGAASGPGGLSGAINNAADKRVFHVLRGLADVIVVGAGTARAEGYGPATVPLVVVSRAGSVPPSLRGAPSGSVLLATCERAEGLAEARSLLGSEQVVVRGEQVVDLSAVRAELLARGWRHILCEGGPRLLADLLRVGAVDELCQTLVPRVVGGGHSRIVAGADVELDATLASLLEEDGTLFARWVLDPAGQSGTA